jgi:hypothetical protein
MRRALLGAALAAAALSLGATAAQDSPLAAESWWALAPPSLSAITEVASNQGASTLVLYQDVPGWYTPGTGSISALAGLRGSPLTGGAVAIAADKGKGVVAYRRGALAAVDLLGGVIRLPVVGGVPASLALAGSGPYSLAVATSKGLYFGPLGSRLQLVADGPAARVLAPPRPGLAWLALVQGRLWARAPGAGWGPVAGAPEFGASTKALTELANGVVLVGQQDGLVWRGSGRTWDRAFQVLPYGGLEGVPAVSALVADGPGSAYLATDGFGTLLTPDGGYTWYRAAPPASSISTLATVGPVFASRAHGFVVAVSPGAVYLHRLQELPEPPTYSPGSQVAELAGTAGVTAGSALLATLLLWLWSRRRPRRCLSSEVGAEGSR